MSFQQGGCPQAGAAHSPAISGRLESRSGPTRHRPCTFGSSITMALCPPFLFFVVVGLFGEAGTKEIGHARHTQTTQQPTRCVKTISKVS